LRIASPHRWLRPRWVRVRQCADNLAGLPAADGVVPADSNWGNAEMALFSIDPAVVANDSGMTVNPDLDLWNPTTCETSPGQFGDTVKTLYDYVDKWLSRQQPRELTKRTKRRPHCAARETG
jgi:hypothetical protein